METLKGVLLLLALCAAIILVSTSIHYMNQLKYFSAFTFILAVFYELRFSKSDTETILTTIVYSLSAWFLVISFGSFSLTFLVLFALGLGIIYLIILREEEEDRESILIIIFGCTIIFLLLYFFHYLFEGSILYSFLATIALGVLWILMEAISESEEVLFFLIIFLFLAGLFFYFISKQPINPLKVEPENKRNEIIRRIVNEEKEELKEYLRIYTDSLKNSSQSLQYFVPKIDFSIRLEGSLEILNYDFSYDIVTNSPQDITIEEEVKDYRPGYFRLVESPGAELMLNTFDDYLQQELRSHLDFSKSIQIELHGFSDALKFNPEKPKIYDGGEGKFPKEETLGRPKIYDFKLNGERTRIILNKKDTLNNSLLAFLRAYCLYDDYIVKEIGILKKFHEKTEYSFHATTFKSQKEIGPDFRKVKITIEIISERKSAINKYDLRNDPKPNQKEKSKFLLLLLRYLNSALPLLMIYLLGRYQKKKDEKKRNLNEIFLLIFILAVWPLLIWVYTWI